MTTDPVPRATQAVARIAPTAEWLAHTAEVRLRVRGPTLAALAVEAGRALARVQLGRAPPPARGPWRAMRIQSSDPAALLVDWLNELIYLAETQRWVAVEIELEDAGDAAIAGRARGARVPRAPSRVKAATFHGLRVDPVPGGLEAEIVLDV
jgi:SHS2 domain-containing protein